jgi:aryl-alcohol dehydrogenase-like predicted oxidoreductase
VTHFDTAEAYGPWVHGELVAEALAPYRDQVVIATKFNLLFDAEGKPQGQISRPEDVKAAAEGHCAASVSRRSSCTTCIWSTRRCRSRTLLARSPT